MLQLFSRPGYWDPQPTNVTGLVEVCVVTQPLTAAGIGISGHTVLGFPRPLTVASVTHPCLSIPKTFGSYTCNRNLSSFQYLWVFFLAVFSPSAFAPLYLLALISTVFVIVALWNCSAGPFSVALVLWPLPLLLLFLLLLYQLLVLAWPYCGTLGNIPSVATGSSSAVLLPQLSLLSFLQPVDLWTLRAGLTLLCPSSGTLSQDCRTWVNYSQQ